MAAGQLGHVLRHIRQLIGATPADASSDAHLLERFVRDRDDSAFAAIVERYGPLVLGLCRRIVGDAHDADDAFQAAFLVLARKAGSIQKTASVGSWLYGVAYRTSLRARAVGARRRALETRDNNLEYLMASAPPAPSTEAAELRPLLDAELARMPEKYRAPLILCYLEGKTNDEAARQLGWPKGTVQGRLARAREVLKDRLTRRGVALAATSLAVVPPDQALAAVSTSLHQATVDSALHFAAGTMAPAPATILAQEVLHSMSMHRIKLAAVLLLALGLAGGVGLGAHLAITPTATPTAAAAPAAAPEPAAAWQETMLLDAPPKGAKLLGLSPDGKTLIYQSSHLVLWELATNKERARTPIPKDHNTYLFLVANGRLACGIGGNNMTSVRLWDVATGKDVQSFRCPDRMMHCAALSPDGKTFAAGGFINEGGQPAIQGEVKVWDVATGKLRFNLKHKGRVRSVAFSPDGKTLAAGHQEIVLWDLAAQKPHATLPIDPVETEVTLVGFSPNGKSLLSASGSIYPHGPILRLWSIEDRKPVRLPTRQDVQSADFLPDGKTLAVVTGGDVNKTAKTVVVYSGQLEIYDVASGKRTAMLAGEKLPSNLPEGWSKGALRASIAGDGRLLAVQDTRGPVTIWQWK